MTTEQELPLPSLREAIELATSLYGWSDAEAALNHAESALSSWLGEYVAARTAGTNHSHGPGIQEALMPDAWSGTHRCAECDYKVIRAGLIDADLLDVDDCTLRAQALVSFVQNLCTEHAAYVQPGPRCGAG